MKKIRIIIADDHPLLRKGIRSALEDSPGLEVVAEAADGASALELADKLKPDIVILDITMPGGVDGIEAARRLRKSTGVRIVILSMHQSRHYAVEALRAGANGYVLKGSDAEELITAIDKIMSGKSYISPIIAEELLNNYVFNPSDAGDPLDMLSDREREIFKLIAEGAANREISEKLVISNATLKKHKYNLMKKLNVNDTAGLIKAAIQRGLLKTADKP